MNEPEITRRGFLQCSAAATGAFLATSLAESTRAAPAEDTPNIAIIISDDQGWADYSFMGHPHIDTPNLDQLAAESVTFTRGYVAAPLCCPSLASMVTGLHPHQHKITSNDPPYHGKPQDRWKKPWSPERIQQREEMMANIERVPTLPGMLQDRGYLSMQTGKWWAGSYQDGGFTHGMTHGDVHRGGRHGDKGLAIGRRTMQPIYDFINEAGDQPFFLWYAPMLPHLPHNPPDRLFDKYNRMTNSVHLARYWAMCEFFDETCGDLLDYLDEQNLSDNTMVLYICDNGWIQREDAPRFAPRSKRSPYEGGIRTPLMVRWPGHMSPRMDRQTPVTSVDLAPTILNACGLEPTDAMQGLNVLDEDAIAFREAIFGASYTHDARDIEKPDENLETRWLIRDWWKLLVHQPDLGKDPELYNLEDDPHEENDLASENPEIVSELHELLDQWYEPD